MKIITRYSLYQFLCPPVNYAVPHERWYSQFCLSRCKSWTNVLTQKRNRVCLGFDLFIFGQESYSLKDTIRLMKEPAKYVSGMKYLTFKRPTFAYTNACKKKTPLEINFIYLGNKEIYRSFKICCIISFYFPQNAGFFFFKKKILESFINRALKFKYKPSRLKVKICQQIKPCCVYNSMFYYIYFVLVTSTLCTLHLCTHILLNKL
jgi:hypothetical protein